MAIGKQIKNQNIIIDQFEKCPVLTPKNIERVGMKSIINVLLQEIK